MTPDDERLLQDILCGDATERDPAVQARLAADPALAHRLARLRAAAGVVDALTRDSPAAVGTAPPAEPADRARVAAALRPRRRATGRRWLLLAGAAAAITLVVVLLQARGGDARPAEGLLGGDGAVTLQHEGGRWRVVVDDTLPPGASYHLRLELTDGTSSHAASEARVFDFPEAWNEALRRAGAARLVVEWDDGTGLFARRVLPLR